MSLPVRGDGAGFRDALCFDFTDPDQGASALLRVTVFDHGLRAHWLLLTADEVALGDHSLSDDPPGDWSSIEIEGARVSDDGRRASIAVESDRGGFEAEITRGAGVGIEPGSAFTDATGLTEETSAARVEGEWHAGGKAGQVACAGRVVRTSGVINRDGIELLRSLTVVLEDGSLLAFAAARPAGAAGHGDEAATALLADPGGPVTRFDEPLVSTEFNSSGEPRRVGVELWPSEEDAVAVRGAGTRVAFAAGSTFLRFTLDGKPGTGLYGIAPVS